MSIQWNVEEAEADFILSTLNGQSSQWTVMQRSQLIQKLMAQAQPKPPAPAPDIGKTYGEDRHLS